MDASTDAPAAGSAKGYPRYELFVQDPAVLLTDHDLALTLRDLRQGRRKYLAMHVVARVTRGAPAPEGYERLRVRSAVGHELPGTWWIQVLEVLPSRLPGTPYSRVDDALASVTPDHRGAGPSRRSGSPSGLPLSPPSPRTSA